MSPAGIVLAGGASRRLGHDKLALVRHGATLLDIVVAGAAEVCDPLVLVGPRRPLTRSPGAVWTREDPPGGGPVAALAAGLAAVPTTVTVIAVLAGDAPRGPAAVRGLLAALTPADDAVILRGADGRDQPLCGVYRSTALFQKLAAIGDPTGAALRDLLDGLAVRRVYDADALSSDIDTPADAVHHGFDLP